jgi:hypothetical protein
MLDVFITWRYGAQDIPPTMPSKRFGAGVGNPEGFESYAGWYDPMGRYGHQLL